MIAGFIITFIGGFFLGIGVMAKHIDEVRGEEIARIKREISEDWQGKIK